MNITPFTPCERCKDSRAPEGYLYVRIANSPLAIKECECRIAWRNKEKLRLDASKANLWFSESIVNYDPLKDYLGTKSLKNVNNLKKYLDNIEDQRFSSASIYMWGPNGTQKTYLAQWLGLELLKKKLKVKYLLMNQLIKDISSTFESDPLLIAKKEEYLNVDVLILDESFSKDKITLYKSGYQIPFLDSFLRERIDTLQKGVVFVSNTSPDKIASQGFSDSIQDLILRKTKPVNSVFEMNDVYMQLKSSFDVTSLFA